MNRQIQIIRCFLLASTLMTLDSVYANETALAEEANAIAQSFLASTLQSVTQTIALNGPVNAVNVCRLIAPNLTAGKNMSSWQAGRTALRIRNPQNRPDAWERKILEQFQKRAEQGEPLSQMSHYEVVDGRFRFMKAVTAGEVCLTCHGKQIDPGVSQILNKEYPGDQATGFSLGELRGALTLSYPLNNNTH